MMDNKKFAGIRLRLLAAYVDGMILALPITFLLWYAGISVSIPISVQRLFLLLTIWILFFVIINLLHEIFFTHYFGGTVGKLLTGLKVIDENGNKLTLKRSFFRHTVGYQFSAILFGLGFLAIIKDPQKQAWHDKAVGSKVIVEKKQWPLALFMLLFLLISNLYIVYSAFNAAFSGPLPEEFKTFMNSFQTKKESQGKIPSVVTPKNNEFCTKNSDCKLIYSSCDCEAVPISDIRTRLEDALDRDARITCIRNSCDGFTGIVTAICENSNCVKSIE